jgi:hypothetical protein
MTEEHELHVVNVARAAVYLLGLGVVDGDHVKIPLEHWINFKAVLLASLLTPTPEEEREAQEALDRYNNDPQERQRAAEEVNRLIRVALTPREP